jgi:hypothetical protein
MTLHNIGCDKYDDRFSSEHFLRQETDIARLDITSLPLYDQKAIKS